MPVPLRPYLADGTLWRREGERLECTACAHRCRLADGATGACGVRVHEAGRLRVPFGYVAARRIRPVETNTIYHLVPGALALTFGMYGCDLRCPYCHNARLSQAPRATTERVEPTPTTAAALVNEAVAAGCQAVCAAYNEPMITAEWAYAIFAEARRRGLRTALISDGHTTPEALAYMRPVTDVYRVDLKGFDETQYAELGGRLAPVLEAITLARGLGYWVEVVTLVAPDFNDELRGLRTMARWLADLDPDIPWHLNAFQPRYEWRNRPPQAAGLLVSAAGAAYARGLRHVYVGNVALTELSHTRCPTCRAVLVERAHYRTIALRLRGDGCPACGTSVPGVWTPGAARA